MYPDACSRRRTSRPPCASRLRRFPCTSHRCVPIRTPPCKTRCIRRMPTSCCCRTALLPRNHNPLCTHRAAHLRLPAPDTAACDSAPVPTMSVRFPTVTPPIAISSLPSPATLSPLSPIHPPIHRFPASLPGVALTLRQLKPEMSGGTVRDLIGSWHLLRGLPYPTHSRVKFAAPPPPYDYPAGQTFIIQPPPEPHPSPHPLVSTTTFCGARYPSIVARAIHHH
jgi:hypothetical protein